MEDALKHEVEREVVGVNAWQAIVLTFLGWGLQLWCRTLRFSISEEDRKLIAEGPSINLFWHNKLFIAAEIHRRYRKGRPACGLVSASRDGAYLAYFYRRLGIEPIRGSSSYRGAQALQGAIRALAAGKDVGITPDGPRGPRHSFKTGAIYLARKASIPLTLGNATYGPARELNSWDGFQIPYPFTRITLRFCKVEPTELEGDEQALADSLRERLLKLGQEAK